MPDILKAYAVALVSLLAGAAFVHNLYKPDLVSSLGAVNCRSKAGLSFQTHIYLEHTHSDKIVMLTGCIVLPVAVMPAGAARSCCRAGARAGKNAVKQACKADVVLRQSLELLLAGIPPSGSLLLAAQRVLARAAAWQWRMTRTPKEGVNTNERCVTHLISVLPVMLCSRWCYYLQHNTWRHNQGSVGAVGKGSVLVNVSKATSSGLAVGAPVLCCRVDPRFSCDQTYHPCPFTSGCCYVWDSCTYACPQAQQQLLLKEKWLFLPD